MGKKGFSLLKIKKKINLAKNLFELQKIFEDFILKEKGIKELKNKEEIKQKIRNLLEKKRKEFLPKEKIFDYTLPPKRPERGHLHPITLVLRKICDIFQSLGFSVVEGPEVEDEWHNFDALNIPPEHPAREFLSLGKTFYLEEKKLLRTHTSSVQIRFMEKNQPPFRIVSPGKVFRKEATDASHEIEFWQLEGLMVSKTVTVANFKAIILEFFKKFFKKEVEVRLRPSYFPFTEPSFEVDIGCVLCDKKGCSSCGFSGYLEIGGAGMVNQKVFEAVGYQKREWQGFAFGLGINRLAMIKYKIPDIRLFLSSNLKFLKQF